MGVFMKEDDIYISSMLELLNLRFGLSEQPGANSSSTFYGGIDEMVALQKQFGILKKGRPFSETARVLNLGGFWNARAKNRWYKLLDSLQKATSNVEGKTGDQAIVNALIENLESKEPRPARFTAHEMRTAAQNKVIITTARRSVFYIERDFLEISLAMKPREKGPDVAKKKTR